MKKLLNKKGFTLVELLAVIVVLAIIMLVVADRVGDAMKQSRGDSLLLQVKSMEREIDKKCIIDNMITPEEITVILENSGLEYTSGAVYESDTVLATAKTGSKLANIKVPKGYADIIIGDSGKKDEETGEYIPLVQGADVKQPVVAIKVSCPIISS